MTQKLFNYFDVPSDKTHPGKHPRKIFHISPLAERT